MFAGLLLHVSSWAILLQSTSTLAMYPEEVQSLEETLSGLTAAITTNATCALNSKHVEAVIGVLERWPASQRFPGSFVTSDFLIRLFHLTAVAPVTFSH